LRSPLPAGLHAFLHELTAAAGDVPQRIDAALADYL
jgi:hypothetical protein